VEVTPKYEGGEYTLYQRDHYLSGKAPMKKVKRFVTPTVIHW